MAIKIHFKGRLDLSGMLLVLLFHRTFVFANICRHLCHVAIKVICSELQTDHTYQKQKYGLLLCN